MQYQFPKPERMNQSDGKLYSFAVVHELDASDIDYRLSLIVHTADPALERRIGREVCGAVNARNETIRALQTARRLLDSVAFVATEGDTAEPIARIDAALKAIKGE